MFLSQIYVMKLQKSVEDYLHLVDTAVLPVLTRGLMSKTERVQAEFIEILLEAALEDGRLGNSVNISSLLNDTDDPGSLNSALSRLLNTYLIGPTLESFTALGKLNFPMGVQF